MNVQAIMIDHTVVISPQATVAEAVQLMLTHNVRNLFVVDDHQHLLGTLSAYRLTRAVLPRAATLEHNKRLKDLSFMNYDVEQVENRLLALRSHRVAELMETDTPVAQLETPILDGVMMLHRSGTRVPVVDEQGRLVGAITYRRLLSVIHQDFEEHKP